MTIKDKIKSIADYFNLELSEFDKKKLHSIIYEEPKIIFKTKSVQKPLYVVEKPVQLIYELSKICELYGVTKSDVIGKSQKDILVRARVHFCRLVKSKDRRVKSIQLAYILQRHHTTILFYWYDCKSDVPCLPLPKPTIKNGQD